MRYSHPLQDRIGTLFNDGDEEPALRHQEYLSQAVGVLAPAVRAFVPVMADEGTRQVAVVGILVPTLGQTLESLRFQLYSSLLIGETQFNLDILINGNTGYCQSAAG